MGTGMNMYLSNEEASSQAAEDAQQAVMAEILQDLELAEETLDELEGQFGSECAMLGDAWPGAALQVLNQLNHVNHLRAKISLPLRASRLRSFYALGARNDGNPDLY